MNAPQPQQQPSTMPNSMSRYRSQRKVAPASAAVLSPPPIPTPPADHVQNRTNESQNGETTAAQSVQRSRSRYRNKRPGTAPSDPPNVPALPVASTLPDPARHKSPPQAMSVKVSHSSQNLRSKPDRYHQPMVAELPKSRSVQDLRAAVAQNKENASIPGLARKGTLAAASGGADTARSQAALQRQLALQHLAGNQAKGSMATYRFADTAAHQMQTVPMPMTMQMSTSMPMLAPSSRPMLGQMQMGPSAPNLYRPQPEYTSVEQMRYEMEKKEEAERLRWHRKREQELMKATHKESQRQRTDSRAQGQADRDATQNRRRAEQAEQLRRQKFREMQRDAADRSDALQKQEEAREAREEQLEKIQQMRAEHEARRVERQRKIGAQAEQRLAGPSKPELDQQQVSRHQTQRKRVDAPVPKEIVTDIPEESKVVQRASPSKTGTDASGGLIGEDERSISTRSGPDTSTLGPRPSTSREMFGFLKKKKSSDAQSLAGKALGRSRTVSGAKKSVDTKVPPLPGLDVPGIDAPVSAVNAGERHVTLECGRSRRIFPVTPSTTPMDLMRSAAIVMSETIDPKVSILYEDFAKVGVRRPLRKYEHIRDVMNSWDDDLQNTLVLLPSPNGGNDPNLEAACVSDDQPGPVNLWLSYSNKPGKWEKRWVVLRQDGQVQHAKKEDSQQKDFVNICHISDFDIYTPDPKTMAKRIRPPKKHCFAIKSQQKSNMFETMDNFVHFFATADKAQADIWYNSVQGWRSWYLVNMLGEGKKSSQSGLLAGVNSSHQRNASNQSAYQLGSFQPLLDLDMFKDQTTDFLSTSHTRASESVSRSASTKHRPTTSRSGGPPSSFPKTLAHEGSQSTHNRVTSNAQSLISVGSGSTRDENMFAPSGLLGRAYSQRQKAQQEREAVFKTEDGFVEGSNLLSDLNSTSRNPESQDQVPELGLGRSTSRRGPKPLIDFSAAHPDSTQTTLKGRGYFPDHIGSGGLIEAATSPENASALPPTGEWRRSLSGRKRDSGADYSPQDPQVFLQDGLLANARAGVGEGRPGRGIMDGSKAQGPMLDLGNRSKFAMGSLLAKVEKTYGPDTPVIDRKKEGEVIQMRTGEGM